MSDPARELHPPLKSFHIPEYNPSTTVATILTVLAAMYTSELLCAATWLLTAVSAAPVEQQALANRYPPAKYPYDKDPYDRKHDTYGDGVQPLPIVCCLLLTLLKVPG
jgi:hypothetical protein